MTSRAALLANLETVEAAVSDSTAVPVLAQFWFTGKRLVAFNGIIGISVPCETAFKGGVPKTIKQLLETSAATEIELQHDKDVIHVKAASSKFKLAVMPLEDFDDYLKAQPPVPKEPYEVDVSEFVTSMQIALRAVGSTEKVRADMMGVTIIQDGKELHLFGHNGQVCGYGIAKGKMDAKRVIIPLEWCKQAIGLFKDKPDAVLEFTQGDGLAYDHESGIKLWASTLVPDDTDSPFFEDVVEPNEGDSFDLPEKFAAAIKRAAIIGKAGVVRTKTSVAIEKGGMVSLYTASEAGEVKDQFILKGHGAVDVEVDASCWAEGADLEQLRVTEYAAVFSKEDGRLSYYVSHLSKDA